MGKGKRYRAEHIHPGVVGYPEDPEIKSILVSPEALEKMRKSFIGKPVVNMEHSNLSPEELLTFTPEQIEDSEVAVGVVADSGKLDNGFDYVDFVVWDEETQKNIDERGFSVSNAYLPSEFGDGGEENAIPYDAELLDGEYLHLAIVPNPRYNKAKVYANQKPTKEGRMKLFKIGKKAEDVKKNQAPEDEKKKDEESAEELEMSNAYVEMENGEKVPLEEAMNAYKAAKERENAESENVMNMEDEVELDTGEKVKVADLMKAYAAEKEMENAEPPTDTTADEAVDEDKQKPFTNSASGKKKPVNKELKNAAAQGGEFAPAVQTRAQRIKAGTAKYSSTVAQGGE